MDTEEAWRRFKSGTPSQIQKAEVPVQGQLDTIQAQLNQLMTDAKRIREIVPKIMGDQGAVDAANNEAAMQQQMMGMMGGGAPPGMEGAEEPPEEEEGDQAGLESMFESGEGQEDNEEKDEDEGEEGMTDEEIKAILDNARNSQGGEGGAEEAPAPETTGETGGEVPPEEIPANVPEEEAPVEEPVPTGEPAVTEEPVPEEQEVGEEMITDDPISRIMAAIDQEAHAAIDENRTGDLEAIMDAKRAVEAFAKSASCETGSVEESESDAAASNEDIADNPVEKARDSEIDEKRGRDAWLGRVNADEKLGRNLMGDPQLKKIMARTVRAGDANQEVYDPDAQEERHKKYPNGPRSDYGPNKGRGYSPEEMNSGKSPKKSYLTEPPSMEEMMGIRKSNPKGNIYDEYISIKKSMGLDGAEPIEKARDAEIDDKRANDVYAGRYEALEKLGKDSDNDPQLKKIFDRIERANDAIDRADYPGFRERLDKYNSDSPKSDYGPNKGRGYSPEELGRRKSESVKESASDPEDGAIIDDGVSDDFAEEQIDDESNEELGELVAYCLENGITPEDIEAMSPEELDELVSKAKGNIPDEGQDIEQTEEGSDEGGEPTESTEPTEPTESIDKSDDGIASAHDCPCEGGPSHPGSKNPDSIASAKPINLTPDKSEGTSHSVEGFMPNSGTQNPNGIATADPTTGTMVNSIGKTGKHIMSMQEMLDVRKSQSRPDSSCGTNGDISRPNLGPTTKSAAEPIDFNVEGLAGFKKSIQKDWEEYKASKAQREF